MKPSLKTQIIVLPHFIYIFGPFLLLCYRGSVYFNVCNVCDECNESNKAIHVLSYELGGLGMGKKFIKIYLV